jgi:flagellar hook-basal body complex protein FliE
MIPPIGFQQVTSIAAEGPPAARAASGAAAGGPADFKNTLLDTLDEVNRLHREAGQGIEQLASGQSQNVAEVLSAVRKADIAFSLLMEMRNKLVEAYRELQQMRV